MSEQQHTPEPWYSWGGYIENHNNDVIASLQDSRTEKENISNARRIVACINACAGIPDYQLTGEGGEPTNLAGVIDEIRKQRDKLLAALEEIKADGLSNARIDAIANKAIASVKGGAA